MAGALRATNGISELFNEIRQTRGLQRVKIWQKNKCLVSMSLSGNTDLAE